MLSQPIPQAAPSCTTALRLPRSLTAIETWGFGLTGTTGWISAAPALHAALGPSALLVWLPCVIVTMLINFQVQQLGMRWLDVSGGTPNYIARLLKPYPRVGQYLAIGYWLGWVSFPAVNAIVLTDLIRSSIEPQGIHCPKILLQLIFTAIAFIVAFSGTRAVGILHLFFVIPAVGLILVFTIQGMSWLMLSPASPGLFPNEWSWLSFGDWAKWYFIATYVVYAGEVASSFVADSQKPAKTLRFLSFAAWLFPPVYLAGSWVMMRLATAPNLDGSVFPTLAAAAQPFWGQSTTALVTLLIAFPCFLGSATTVSNTPRILYQLALDGQLSPVFAVVSRRGVLGPALIFGLLFSILCLAWGDVAHIVMVTGTSFLLAFIGLHFALWLQRDKPEVRWPWLSLGFAIAETVVLFIGGWAWGWQDLLSGLLLPIIVILVDAALRRIPFLPFHARWWKQLYYTRSKPKVQDFVALQVVVLILLICGATIVGWAISKRLNISLGSQSADLLIILLVTLSFIGVAIACWTTLPQIASIDEARAQAENLFKTALDAILVLDEDGFIVQSNPAAAALFRTSASRLAKHHLSDFFPDLSGTPEQWLPRSEQTLLDQERQTSRVLEASLSYSFYQNLPGYTVILRDVTERQQAETAIRQSEAQLRDKAQQLEEALYNLQQTQAQLVQTEKISSLGQLVAGIAHEVNNPVSFIAGNLDHAKNYTQDLIELITLYQQHVSQPPAQIEDKVEEIDLEYLLEDLPKLLVSMKVGTDRIREIMSSLRTFSRVDANQKQPADIHAGIDSTLLILHHRLKAKPERPEIQLIKKYGELPLVECYAGQLNQVFMNLIANAIDALEEYSQGQTYAEIQANPNVIEICTQVKQEHAFITISDNGPGIPDEFQQQLFHAFFTTKPAGKGTGLGLSISQQIVNEKHGGQLTCISTPGSGTQFVIEIPLQSQKDS